MLCLTLNGFSRACKNTTGGVSEVMIFDPQDFDFTQVAPVSGVIQPYSAITRRTGATFVGGAKMFPLSIINESGEYKWSEKTEGLSVEFDHSLDFQLGQNNMGLANFLQSITQATNCCGIGVAFRQYDGTIFIMGEYSVNGAAIPKFLCYMTSGSGTGGKKFSDFNGANITIGGAYFRPIYEYSGPWTDLTALVTA